ncbi:MAG: hypothetical protein HUJ91_05515, partial [Bacteroidales bacterium]|nr:hypothetical protein [Bacteroidales bacterium]
MDYSNALSIIRFCRRWRRFVGILWLCGFVPVAGIVFSCQNVQPQIDDIASQIALLEQKCSDLSSDVAALQSLAEALKQEDELVSFTPTYGSDGKVTGYTMEFRNSGRISVRDGQSYISAATDQGLWWWTIGGAWMTDPEGNRIEIGGDTPAPSFKFEGDKLLFSSDGGSEWQLVGTIEKPLIESVREDASQVIIT